MRQSDANAKIALMRFTDRWIGTPLCLGFTIIDRFLRLFRSPQPPQQINNILVIILSEMGAAVLGHTAFEELKKRYPGANIYFISFKKNRSIKLFLGLDSDDHIIGIEHQSIIQMVKDTFEFYKLSQKISFDVVLDLELFTRIGGIYSYLSGATEKIGFHRFRFEGMYKGSFQTRKIAYNPYTHIGHNYLAMVRSIGTDQQTPLPKVSTLDTKLEAPRVSPSDEKRAAFREKLFAKFPELDGAKRIVLLNPSGGELPIRAWPMDNYAELGRKLAERDNVKIALMGTPDEREFNDMVAHRIGLGMSVNTAGLTTDIEELLALFEMAELLITNDSGPGNFSSLVDLKTVVFFGPETPILYAPLGENTHVIYKPIQCSPCLTAFNHRNTACDGDNLCLKAISVEEVIKKVDELLD